MKTKLHLNSIFAHGSLIILLLLHRLHSASIKAQQANESREFDYINGSEIGPDKWGELYPEWANCKWGKMQSPIDISNPRPKLIPASKGLHRNYKHQNATVDNKEEHVIMVRWKGDVGSILINGREFSLQQTHWHTPSEHTINGKRYDMELHMVHLSTDNQTRAVISLLYKFGYPDTFLSKLGPSISLLIGETGEEKAAGVINPIVIPVCDKCYYNYVGSLTTPPCTEGVIWIVSNMINTVSRDQVKLLHDAVRAVVKYNARPLQPLNHREVHLYFQEEAKQNIVTIVNGQEFERDSSSLL